MYVCVDDYKVLYGLHEILGLGIPVGEDLFYRIFPGLLLGQGPLMLWPTVTLYVILDYTINHDLI